jgi:hypothetical protein
MTQPYVALTDYGLSLECIIFLFLLAPVRFLQAVRFWFFIFFFSLAAASFIGGTVHGFFEQPSFVGERILWPLTMICIGVTSLSGAQIGKNLLGSQINSKLIDLFTYGAFLFYCAVVLFINSRFFIAILGYLPAICFLGWALMNRYLHTQEKTFFLGVAGLGIILFASVIQQLNILDASQRNVIYHVLQAVGLFMVFNTARLKAERVGG